MEDYGVARGYIDLDISKMKASVQAGIRELDNLDRRSELVQSEFNKLQSASAKTGNIFQQAAQKSRVLTEQINQAKAKCQVYNKEITTLNTVVAKAKEKQSALKNEIRDTTTRYERAKAKVQEAAAAHGRESEEYANAVQKSKELENGLTQLQNQYDALGAEVEQSEQSIVEFRTRLNNTEASINNMNRELSNSQNRLLLYGQAWQGAGERLKAAGAKISAAGSMLTLGVTTPVIAAGTASVKMASDAETSFAKVSTIADGAVLSYSKMKDGVTKSSNDTGVAITEFNEALYSSLSAGVDSGNAIGFTTDMVKLAKGGFTDTAKAVDVVTTVLNAYGLSAEEASSISDKLILTQNIGKTTVDELASSLGRVIPTAKSVGVDMDNVSASMAILTKRGIATAEATTYYNGMLNELGSSGSVADKALRKMAGQGFQELIANGTPVTEVLRMLEDYAKKSGKSLSDMFGSSEAGKAALSIMSDGGKEYNEVLQKMADSAGTAQEAFNTMDATPAAKMQKEFNKLKNVGIDVGGKLLPIVTDMVQGIGKLADSYSKLSPKQQETILKTVGYAAAMGPLLKVTGSAVKGVGSLATGFGKLLTKMGETRNVDDAANAAGGLSKILGGIGPVAGIAAVGVTAVGVAAYAAFKKAKKEVKEASLEEHFGDVKLSAEEVEDVAKRLTTRDWTVKLDAVIEAQEKLDQFEGELNNTIDELNKTEWKISVGLELTEEEKASYKENLLNFAAQAVQYMEQQRYTATLAIDAILTPGTAAHTDINSFTQSFYSGLNAELTQLGKELADLVSQGFSDNTLPDAEMSALIAEKQKQIQDKLDQIAQAEYDLKLQNIRASAPKEGLDAESFQELQDQLTEQLEERKKQIEEYRLELLIPYQAKLNNGEISPEEFEAARQEIDRECNDKLGNVTVDNVNIELETINDNYDSEIQESVKNLEDTLNTNLKNVKSENITWREFWANASKGIENGVINDGTVSSSISKFLQNMQPNIASLEEIAQSYRDAGKIPPQNILDSLNDAYQLEALAGGTDRIYEVMAKQVMDSPEYQKVLAGALKKGEEVPEELITALEQNYGLVYDATDEMWKQMGDSTNKTQGSLISIMEQCGLATSGAAVNSFYSKSPEMQEKTIDLLNQIALGKDVKQEEILEMMDTFGLQASDSAIQALAYKSPELQSAAMDLLDQLGNGTVPKQEEVEAMLNAFGFSSVKSVTDALVNKSPEMQLTAMSLLDQLGNGTALKQDEIKTMLAVFGYDSTNSLTTALASKSPEVQRQALELFAQLQTAEGSKRSEIIAQLKTLGSDVTYGLADSLDKNTGTVKKSANNTIDVLWSASKDRITYITPGYTNATGMMAKKGVSEMDNVTSKSKLTAPGMKDANWVPKANQEIINIQNLADKNPIVLKLKLNSSGIPASLGIQGFADGGIANSPSIFGEAGPEMAIPLSQSKRKRALSLYEKTGEILGVAEEQSVLRTAAMDTLYAAKTTEKLTSSRKGILGMQELNYDVLADKILSALRRAPIQNNVTVEMEDGDVYLDKEKAGRTLAPVVSRVISLDM